MEAPETEALAAQARSAAVAALWAGVRLLTLLGPPGIGKTRLAIQVAEEAATLFGGAVCFVALATVSEPDLVAPNC